MRAESAQGLNAAFKTTGSFFAPSYYETTAPEDNSPWPEISFAIVFAFAIGATVAFEAFSNSANLRYHLPIAMAVLLLVEGILLSVVLRHDWRQKTALAYLKESEARTSLAAESARLGIWRWDSVSDTFWGNRT